MRKSMRIVICAAVSIPLMGQSSTVPATFDVASVKRNPAGYGPKTRWKDSPGRLQCTDVPLKWVISRAYRIQASQVSGPTWLDSEGYDIDATFPVGTGRQPSMLQNLLAERFKLVVHRETKDLPAYVLALGKTGTKLQEVQDPDSGLQLKMNGAVRHLKGKTSLARLVTLLSDQLHMTVVDKTGLKGTFDISLDYTINEDVQQNDGDQEVVFPVATAMEKQLGLKLELMKQPMEILVIDYAEKVPVAN
jgi:uncharacterized protein (TIGR03435 family)